MLKDPIPHIPEMKTAQAQPDFRLTEIMLSLNAGSEESSSPNSIPKYFFHSQEIQNTTKFQGILKLSLSWPFISSFSGSKYSARFHPCIRDAQRFPNTLGTAQNYMT